MGLKTILRGVGKAIPVIVTYLPVIAGAVRQVKEALKPPQPAQPAADAPAPAAPAAAPAVPAE
jgi:hypothetical protein